MNWNTTLGYATPKFVIVRDWRLGLMKIGFMLMIFGKVIVLDLCVNCLHLKPHSAVGTGFIDLIPPECPKGKHCKAKYSDITALKYCKRFANKSLRVKNNSKIGDFITKRQVCKYYDENQLVWVPQQMSTMFIPLKNVVRHETQNPACYDGSDKADATIKVASEKGGDEVKKERRLKDLHCEQEFIVDKTEEYYVADIGEFTLEFRHSFESKETDLFGTAAMFQGFFAACKSNHVKDARKECRRMMVPGSTGDTVPEDLVNLEDPKGLAPSLGVGPKGGDAIQLKDLLKLTPVAQENDMEHDVLDRRLPDFLQLDGHAMRDRGGMLMVEVDYTNFVPMRPGIGPLPLKPVTYTYRPFFVPANLMTRNRVAQVPSSTKRIVETWYGLEIKMDFAGKMVKFDWTEVIAAMTTGLVLMSAAVALTDGVMTTLMPLKDKYKLLKYQTSEDYTDAIALNSFGLELKSGMPSSELMLKKLNPEGIQCADLEQKELMYMLNSHDIRLNRLDGMCDQAEFSEGSDKDKKDRRWCNMGNFKRDFYKSVVGDKDKNLDKFSDHVNVKSTTAQE